MKVKAKKDFIADFGLGTQRIQTGQVLDLPAKGEVLYWLDQGWVEEVKKQRARRAPAAAETAAIEQPEKAIKPRARKKKI